MGIKASKLHEASKQNAEISPEASLLMKRGVVHNICDVSKEDEASLSVMTSHCQRNEASSARDVIDEYS